MADNDVNRAVAFSRPLPRSFGGATPNDQGTPEPIDPYDQAKAQEGGSGSEAGAPIKSASKSYGAKESGAAIESKRQRAMMETQEQFTGTEPEGPSGIPEQTAEQGEEQAFTTGRQGSEGAASTQLARAQQLAGMQMAAQQQREQQDQQTASTRTEEAQKRASEKKKSKMARQWLRRTCGVLIPVVGILVAWNIELIHDRFIPILSKKIRREKHVVHEALTIMADALVAAMILIQLLIPIAIIGAVAYAVASPASTFYHFIFG